MEPNSSGSDPNTFPTRPVCCTVPTRVPCRREGVRVLNYTLNYTIRRLHYSKVPCWTVLHLLSHS